jgi:hypothetical protein
MTTFDERTKAFEQKFAHDAELAFKVTARRNKLLGLWAAKLMANQVSDEAYAKEIVIADFEAPGEEDVLARIMKDFAAANVTLTEKEVRFEMRRLMEVAKQQLMEEAA